MTNLPDPTPGGNYPAIDELLGQQVDVAGVGFIAGVAHVLVNSKWYVCENDWASAGATALQAEMRAQGIEQIKVRVVQEQDQIGFRE